MNVFPFWGYSRSGNFSKGCAAALVTTENAQEVFQERDAANSSRTVLGALEALAPRDGNCLPLVEMNTALIVPWPFVHLVARSRWGHIAMQASSRWPACSAMPIVRLWRQFELSDNEPNNLVGDVSDDEANLFQTAMFQQIADYLRDNVQTLERPADDPAAERARVGMYVQWLERCVDATAEEAAEGAMFDKVEGRGGHYFKHLGRHGKYFSDFS